MVGDWSKFTRLLRKNPDVAGVLLASNGGSADDGLAIAKHVFEAWPRHQWSPARATRCARSSSSPAAIATSPPAPRASRCTAPHKQLGDWVVEDDITNGTVAWFIGHMGYPLPLARLWVSTPDRRDRADHARDERQAEARLPRHPRPAPGHRRRPRARSALICAAGRPSSPISATILRRRCQFRLDDCRFCHARAAADRCILSMSTGRQVAGPTARKDNGNEHDHHQ